MNVQLTARQSLELRGSKIYFILYTSIFGLSVLFQVLGGVHIQEILPNLIVNILGTTIAFTIYRKK